jgi:Domain of unknown function (DUF4833)
MRTRTKPRSTQAKTLRRFFVGVVAVMSLTFAANVDANGRELVSQVTELDHIPSVRPEFPVPNEPNMLFYIQRSVNSNTVIYAANRDSNGSIDPTAPIVAYWRWYNVDGHKKPLNFIERMMAYGVKSVARGGPNGAVTFKVAAMPEQTISVDLDNHGHPEALMKIGERWIKLDYVYLQVDNSGLLPSVTAMDIFGIDKLTGKALRDHIVPH